jgi:hypothetical protein
MAVDPAQLAQQLEDLNRELDKVEASIKSIASNLTGKLKLDDVLRKSSQAAKDLADEFEKGENVSKKIQKQLNTTRDAIEKNLLKEVEYRAKGNRLEANNLVLQRQVLYQIDAQLRTLQKINEEYQKQNNLFALLGSKLKDFGRSIREFFSVASIFKMLIDGALRFNKISVDISKNLDYGADNANRVTNEMVRMARSSDNINVTLANAAEAMSQLNSATGFNVELSRDVLETQIMLTKQLGLSGDEAAIVYKFSLLTGKSSSQLEKSLSRAYVTNKNALKVGTSYKEVLAALSKTSGELAVSLGTNPNVLAKAVVQAKAFGTTLEQVKSQGDALLDFETSLENELKAELLTGEQLNLERARAAALAGDQVALAQELNNQGMTLAKFEKMNVLGRRAYAQALGLSSDELADQLRKQKMAVESGKSLAQLTQKEADEAKKRQDIQTKFNQGIDKLKDIIGSLLAGPLGAFIDSLANGLGYINKIFSVFGKMGGLISKFFGGKVGNFLGDIASVATIGALIAIVTKSLTKGTFFNPMITKDIGAIGGGGGLMNMFGGGGKGGGLSRIGKAFKGGGVAGAGKAIGRMAKGSSGLAKLAKGTGYLSLLSAGTDLAGNLTDENRSTGNALAKTLDQNKFTALGAGIGALFGGVGAIPGAAIGGLLDFALGDTTQIVKDGIASASRGPFTIMDSYGSTAVTSKGDGLAVSPNINSGGGDSSAVIAAINDLKTALMNRPITISMDSRQVGSALVQSSYKSA